jgi:hypothetical protein
MIDRWPYEAIYLFCFIGGNMSEFLYEVGDEFEGGPIQQNKFITEVLQHGGLVGIDGNIVRILYLPGKGSIFDEEPVKSVVVNYVSDEEVARLEDDGAPVVEAVVEVLDAVQEELEPGTVVVEDFKDIAVVEPAPKPAAKRGRPRKQVSTEE